MMPCSGGVSCNVQVTLCANVQVQLGKSTEKNKNDRQKNRLQKTPRETLRVSVRFVRAAKKLHLAAPQGANSNTDTPQLP